LCDFSDEDGTPPNSFRKLKYFLHMNHFAYVSVDLPYSIKDIPSMGRPFVFSVMGMQITMALY
jgi:hypothetical protein